MSIRIYTCSLALYPSAIRHLPLQRGEYSQVLIVKFSSFAAARVQHFFPSRGEVPAGEGVTQ